MNSKREILNQIKANKAEIRTIHKVLQMLEINKKDVFKLKEQDAMLYDDLKKYCNMLVADMYELVIDRPRQSAQYLTLAKEQEQFYNTIFAEDIDNAIVPEIVIKREKSKTNILIEN